MQRGSLSLSVTSPLIMKDILHLLLFLLLLLSDLSQLFFFCSLSFSLCGVEGIRVLPQVAEATDAAATLLVSRRTMQRKGGKVRADADAAAAAAVQSGTATCGCKNCFHLFSSPSSSSSSSSSLRMLELEGFERQRDREREWARERGPVFSNKHHPSLPSDPHSKHQHHPLTPALLDTDDNRSHSGIIAGDQSKWHVVWHQENFFLKKTTKLGGIDGWMGGKVGGGSTTCSPSSYHL